MEPLIQEYERGMSELESDQRVSKLREALEQKQNELQIYVNHKRLQDHEVHQLH
jgi:hypothetical protein